ncbi:Carboxyl-terminal-processing protease [Triticum urartu]|uniref:Carboxyl-terminal-processing protease n=1 Tax=Triticum urartu TaxID=4572 RepID=M8AC92_TRIUA|nr:Carboxyl-terminal-processing protease [Triticum urartu]
MSIRIIVLHKRSKLEVIYTTGRDRQVQNTIVADSGPLVTTPVMVASALHDNCKAVLVGERTFGKGLIQSVFELHDGSGIVVTVGKYVTPNHKDINGDGIEPDYRRLPGKNNGRKIRDGRKKSRRREEGGRVYKEGNTLEVRNGALCPGELHSEE